MRKKTIACILTAMLTLTACVLRDADEGAERDGTAAESTAITETAETSETAAATEEPESDANTESTDYAALYKPVTDEFYRFLNRETDINTYPAGAVGLREEIVYNENLLTETGFSVTDLTGDGIPELAVAAADGSVVYALYTVKDGEPVLTCSSYARSAYSLLDDGTLFYTGSGSASHSAIGIYVLSGDGQSIGCREYLFSFEKDGDLNDIRIWRNTTGEQDPAVSEETDMTKDEFWTVCHGWEERRVVLPLTIFAVCGGTDDPVSPTVSVAFTHAYTGEYTVYEMDASAFASEIVFYTDGNVQDFKLLKLTMQDAPDGESFTFTGEEIYTHGELTPDAGLSVRMRLPETIPYYGISYTNADGATRMFSINVSGRDGSVYLSEIMCGE